MIVTSLLVVLGMAVGGTVTVPALAISAGGHGWTSAGLTAISAATAPLVGLAWGLRNRRAGQVLIGLLVIVAVIMDIALFWDPAQEGWQYARQV